MKYGILFASIIFNLLTNISFNLSAINDKLPTKKWAYLVLGLVFGLINSILFTESLKVIPLGLASAIFFSITIIGLTLSSYFFFGEAISWFRVTGIFLIISGVLIITQK